MFEAQSNVRPLNRAAFSLLKWLSRHKESRFTVQIQVAGFEILCVKWDSESGSG